MSSNKDFSLMQTFSINENEQGLAPLRIIPPETSRNWLVHGLFPVLLKYRCAGFPFTSSLSSSDFLVAHLQKESYSAQGLCFPSISRRPRFRTSKASGSVRTHCGQHRSLQIVRLHKNPHVSPSELLWFFSFHREFGADVTPPWQKSFVKLTRSWHCRRMKRELPSFLSRPRVLSALSGTGGSPQVLLHVCLDIPSPIYIKTPRTWFLHVLHFCAVGIFSV